MDFQNYLTKIQSELNNVFDEVDRWFDRSEDVRTFRPTNDGWTTNEVLEHISLVNHFLLILILKGKRKALEKTRQMDLNDFEITESDFKKLEEVGTHGAFDWVRPDHMVPTGTADLVEVRGKIKNQVQECLEALEVLKQGQGLSVKITMSVNALGKLDVYQYIYFLAMHAKRHCAQMESNLNEMTK